MNLDHAFEKQIERADHMQKSFFFQTKGGVVTFPCLLGKQCNSGGGRLVRWSDTSLVLV